jgi:glycosyltransferase involved in cell wall biosynthesis
MAVTAVVITKNRPWQVKRLLDSIFDSKMPRLSIVLVDDSEKRNFVMVDEFLVPFKDICEHKSSSELRREVSSLLEGSKISAESKLSIETCVGIKSPFLEFAESLTKMTLFRRSYLSLLSRSFAPYSVSRNLGVYRACRVFRPQTIVFLDDDCYVARPDNFRSALQPVGEGASEKKIVAVSGLYQDLSVSNSEGTLPYMKPRPTLILSGMHSFLKRSFLKEQQQRLTLMPYHMLGGVLILDRRVFLSLPFDPFVPRGEDHAYCIDLKARFGRDFAIVRDNEFVVNHYPDSRNCWTDRDRNALRDIFRFIYIQSRTGESYIPCFTARWASEILLHGFFDPSRSRQQLVKLWALLFLARTYAKRNVRSYYRVVKAWEHFLRSVIVQDP